jgi:hypothetical protein
MKVNKMKKYVLYLIISLLNSVLFLIIPDYVFWFLMILFAAAFICFALILIDILGKTKKWKNALIILGFFALSYVVGILIIVIRNYFLGYYSN